MQAASPHQQQQQPLLVLRNRPAAGSEEGRRQTQISNLYAASKLLPIIRTSLGPRAHQKLLLNPIGGVTITADGFAIVRDLFPDHPVTNLVVNGARAQDEEVGDGTTSSVIITSSILEQLIPIISQPGMHPAYLSKSLLFAKKYLLKTLDEVSEKIDLEDPEKALKKLVDSTIETKQTGKLKDLICKLSIDAIKLLTGDDFKNVNHIDIKKDLRILQIVGESEMDTSLVKGIVIEKDVLHPSMKRTITNPRILLLSDGLEYKKGESQTTIQVEDKSKFQAFLDAEEEDIKWRVSKIVALKPDIVLMEKGSSELANFLLMKAGITAFRRCKNQDLQRLAQASHGRVCTISEVGDEIVEDDLGLHCGKFEVRKHGIEYFSYFTDCREARAGTLVLRGPVKDLLAEIMRNFQDCLYICRTVLQTPKLVPGAGAVELLISKRIESDLQQSTLICHPLDRDVMRAVQISLELIPQILLENVGLGNVARQMLHLKSKLRDSTTPLGINGVTGEILSSRALGVWDPYRVKHQIYKTALDTARTIINIDEIVAITAAKKGPKITQ